MKLINARCIDESILSVTIDFDGAEMVIQAELVPGMAPQIVQATWVKTGADAVPAIQEHLDEVQASLNSAASEFADRV